MKTKCIADLKTSHSQQSEIDVFTRLETNFFEKYVRYTMTDHFHRYLRNVYEEHYYKKLNGKDSKAVATCLYEVAGSFLLQELIDSVQQFFKEKSMAVATGEFPTAIKFLYCNRSPVPNLLKEGELVYIDVRIKLEVARIEEIPGHIHALFQKFALADSTGRTSDHQLERQLRTYDKEYFNVFVMYYGDVHFNFVGCKAYEQKTIKVAGRQLKLRLFVFYISKIALFDTFRSTNKLSVDCINDLAISFYEIKREKARANRLKKQQGRAEQQPQPPNKHEGIGTKTAMVAVGGIVAGIVLAKLLFF